METCLSFHITRHYIFSWLVKLIVILILLTIPIPRAASSGQMTVGQNSLHRIRHSSNKLVDLDSDVFRLKSPCSNGFVKIYNSTISASGRDSNSSTVKMKLERVEGTQFYHILRDKSHNSRICFSRRGKLVLRDRLWSDHRCEFSIQYDNQYVMLRSVANHKWYVGFRKNGKPLRGWHYGRKRDLCFKLIREKVRQEPPLGFIHLGNMRFNKNIART